MNLLIWLIFSFIVGSVAKSLMINENELNRNENLFIPTVIIGMVGCWVGGFLNYILGFTSHFYSGGFISGIIGSCLFIFIYKKIKGI